MGHPPSARPARPRRGPPGRRGAAATEFAIVAPLFLLLLAGILEFGQAFCIKHSLASVARSGARLGIVDGATTAEVKAKVRAGCVARLGVPESRLTVTVAVDGNARAELAQADDGNAVTVTVSVPFSAAGSGFFANLFSTAALSGSCTLEHE